MALTPDQLNVVNRIVKRLRSSEEATYRGGGRAVAAQAVEHRLEVVRVLRSAIAEFGESERNEYQRGYHEALSDVLIATEAALEPKEQEVQARHALTATPILQQVLDRIAPAPLTPSEIATSIGKSAPSAGRYFGQLRALGLVAEMPSASDARERPHRATALGMRLAQRKSPGSDAPAVIDQPSKPRTRTPAVAKRLLEYMQFCGTVRIDADPATGLRLLENFEKLLTSQVELHRKAKLPLTLMRLDIRDFHEFVESADFAGATRLILKVTEMLKQELDGSSAEVARYGFDKFVVMLPCQPEADAKRLATAVLSKLGPVAANVGIASDVGERDAGTLLLASDAALQEAKDAGMLIATA